MGETDLRVDLQIVEIQKGLSHFENIFLNHHLQIVEIQKGLSLVVYIVR